MWGQGHPCCCLQGPSWGGTPHHTREYPPPDPHPPRGPSLGHSLSPSPPEAPRQHRRAPARPGLLCQPGSLRRGPGGLSPHHPSSPGSAAAAGAGGGETLGVNRRKGSSPRGLQAAVGTAGSWVTAPRGRARRSLAASAPPTRSLPGPGARPRPALVQSVRKQAGDAEPRAAPGRSAPQPHQGSRGRRRVGGGAGFLPPLPSGPTWPPNSAPGSDA